MKQFFTKRNIYIGLFAILYITVALVSLIHSFAFFGLANDTAMSIMLGATFEIGQAAVLLSILTSRKDRSRIMPWCLMILLTAVQILGNVFSSYKFLMTNSVADLRYFKEPIFVWTTLPDNVTTVIITYIVGAILPIVALCMTSMISNYLQDEEEEKKTIADDDKKEEVKQESVQIENEKETVSEVPVEETVVEEPVQPEQEQVAVEQPVVEQPAMQEEDVQSQQEVFAASEPEIVEQEKQKQNSHFINL